MWITIFKTGTHTDSAGNTREWTQEDLDAIVSKYDAKEHEAPAVIGHPKTNDPAYGWVEALKREGEVLSAKLKDLVPEFKEMLSKKMFKKRSMSVYPDLSLRHVGFLGAVPPAVKGLPDFQFQDEENILTYEFADGEEKKNISNKDNTPIEHGEKTNVIGNLFQRLREFLIDKFTVEDADNALNSWDIDYLKKPEPQVEESFTQGDIVMSDKELQDQLKVKETELAQFKEKATSVETENKNLKTQLANIEQENCKKEFKNYVEKLTGEAKVLPAQAKNVIDLCEILHSVSEYEFAEGGKKKPVDVFKAFLEIQPKQLELSEIATKDKAQTTSDTSNKLNKLVADKMKDNPKMDYSTAFAEVQKENRELAQAYQAEFTEQ